MPISSRMLLVGESKPFRLFAEELLKTGHPAYRADTVEQALAAARLKFPEIVVAEADLLRDPTAFAEAMAEACAPLRPVLVAVGTGAGPERARLESAVEIGRAHV